MLPGTFIYRAHQRHHAVVSAPLVDKVPQGAHNAHKGKSAPLQPDFVPHTITDISVCEFVRDYTVGALFICLAFSCRWGERTALYKEDIEYRIVLNAFIEPPDFR